MTREELEEMFANEWSVKFLGEYVLIEDGATRYFTTMGDVEAVEEYEDYTDFCDQTSGLKDEDVPRDVLLAAIEAVYLVDLDDEEAVAEALEDGIAYGF